MRGSVVNVSGAKFGDGNFQIIAGPCAIESKEQICKIAQSIKLLGATMLRGGAFKARTSPYSFQGMGAGGIKYLLEAKKLSKLPIVSEIVDIAHIDMFKDVDMIQVGARNMQNFELLKALSKIKKPVLLKRGVGCTIDELLMSAEYLLDGGNDNVILCERGIRTFESSTRATLDISAVPILKQKTTLPVIVDPSHASGDASLVIPMSLAAVATGADGIMVEVHDNPAEAFCDGPQALSIEQFKILAKKIDDIKPFAYDYRD